MLPSLLGDQDIHIERGPSLRSALSNKIVDLCTAILFSLMQLVCSYSGDIDLSLTARSHSRISVLEKGQVACVKRQLIQDEEGLRGAGN